MNNNFKRKVSQIVFNFRQKKYEEKKQQCLKYKEYDNIVVTIESDEVLNDNDLRRK